MQSGSAIPISVGGAGHSEKDHKAHGKDHRITRKQSAFEERVKLWRETFDLVAEKEEHVTADQLGHMLKSLGYNVEENELIHFNYLNKIDFDTFFDIAKEKQKHVEFEHRLRDAFKAFDLEKYGYLSAPVLRHIMCYLGSKLSDEEVDRIFAEFDIDEDDDEVDYDDIVYMIHQRLNTEYIM